MSTTQSHVQTGSQNFNFNPQQRLTQMNARQDVGAMRQPVMPQMAGGGGVGAHFLPNGGQPPMSQILQNAAGNPPMSVLGGGSGGPQGPNPGLNQNQRMQQMQHQAHQRQLMQQAQAAQVINGTGVGTSGPHMGRGGPNQMGNMGFPGNMMQQAAPQGNNPSVRRVQSQPQPLNQQAMHQGQAGGGGGGSGGMMGMGGPNPQGGMPGHMRQAAQPGQGPQPPMQHMQSIPHEMLMRQGIPSGMQQPPPGGQRSTSAQAQLMQGFPQGPQPGMQANNYPPQQQHSHTTSPSPRPGQRSQPQTPANVNIPGQGQPQPNANRSQADIFNFQQPNGIFPPNSNRQNNSQFPFVPSTSPPHPQGGEMGSLSNPPGSAGNREPLFSTPAQQLQNGGDRSNSSQFNMAPPNIPQRPPSNQSQHPLLHQHQQPPQHSSPPQQDFLGQMQQRPQSQPQGQPGRPPSSQATPRTAQQQLPGHGGRMPPLSQPPGQSGGPQQPQGVPIAPRPPQQPPVAGPSSVPTAMSPPDSGPTAGQPGGVSRPPSNYPLGVGQGLTRLLQFSGVLASENKAVNKLSQDYWDALVKEYFAPNALFKFTLWKDNQRQEAKPFDINVPILPRFFLVTAQSGVKSMTLSLDGARERLHFTNHAVVECVTAAWTYKYTNGYTVTLRGPLTAHIIMVPNPARPPGAPTPQQPYSLKFESLDFNANFHDKSISLESISGIRSELSPSRTPRIRNAPTPTANGITGPGDEHQKFEEPRVYYEQASIPGEPVNAFGIPQATMRCLELAESVANMEALISFAQTEGTGPMDSLELYANKVRETAGANTGFQNFPTLNGINANPSVTLYPPPANPGPTNPQSTPSAPTPQNAPGSAQSSPQKQHKTIPQASGGSGSSSGPASASGSTPAMSNATLKRKQTDTASPVTTDGPPAKRTTRGKRRGAGSAS